MLKYFDAFAGIGGFALGMQLANPEFINVGFSEIDKYASSVYQRHFEGHKSYGDITKIDTAEISDFDILVGGFPCQTFSIAGRREGFEDTKGTLFFELARILKDKQPSYFCFENVKGLLSHDNGRTFKVIVATLDELGYDLQWQVLNSKYFGVPQNRERIFIVGNLRDRPRPEVFPIGEHDTNAYGEDAETQIAKTLQCPGKSGGFYSGMNMVLVIGMLNSDKWTKFHESSRRIYDRTGISPTLPTGAGGGHIPKLKDGMAIRQLTPLEYERLQSFPDNWTQFGKSDEPISNTQRYKMCGNAVTVNVVKHIFEKLLGAI